MKLRIDKINKKVYVENQRILMDENNASSIESLVDYFKELSFLCDTAGYELEIRSCHFMPEDFLKGEIEKPIKRKNKMQKYIILALVMWAVFSIFYIAFDIIG